MKFQDPKSRALGSVIITESSTTTYTIYRVNSCACFAKQFKYVWFVYQGKHTQFLGECETLKHALVHLSLLTGTVRDQLVSHGLELILLLDT